MADIDARAIAEALIGASKNLTMWSRMIKTNAAELSGFSPELSKKLLLLSITMGELDNEVVGALAGGLAGK